MRIQSSTKLMIKNVWNLQQAGLSNQQIFDVPHLLRSDSRIVYM